MGHGSLYCLFLCHQLFLTGQLVTAASFHTFCLWKSVMYPGQLVWHRLLACTFHQTLLAAPFTHSRDSPQLPLLWKDHESFKNISRKLLSCGTSSPAVSLSERRVCQPVLCSGMTYATKARPNEVLESSQSYIESSIMFRKYFTNL